MMKLVDHVWLGRAKAARERHVLRRGRRLVAEHEDLAGEEQPLELRKLAGRQRLRNVDARGFDTEAGADRRHLRSHGIVWQSDRGWKR